MEAVDTPLDTIAVKSSVYWPAPAEFDVLLTCRTGRGFIFGIKPGLQSAFFLRLLSQCCANEFEEPNSVRTQPFCAACYKPGPWPMAWLEHRGYPQDTRAWFERAIPVAYDPLTAFIIGADLERWVARLRSRWSRNLYSTDWPGVTTYGGRVEAAVKDLETFSGPIPPAHSNQA